ncbi:MAG TPA: FG-GAP-like repeat-containing protein, partial [Allosphingosinicella sp.]
MFADPPAAPDPFQDHGLLLTDALVPSAPVAPFDLANAPPVLGDLAATVTFGDNQVFAASQIIDNAVTFSDPDDNFNGGTLTVSGLLPEDVVAVQDQGTDPGQIGVSGTDLTYGGTIVGGIDGGNGDTLTVTFNAAADSAAIQALIEDIAYTDTSGTPTASRDLLFDIADDGGLHASQNVTVDLTANSPPFIDLDASDSPATGTAFAWGQGEGPVAIAPNGIVDDPDQPADYGGYTLTVAFTANGTADDQLGILDTGSGPGGVQVSGGEIFFEGTDVASITGGDNGSPLTVSFNANACGCSLDAVVEAITYANDAAHPSTLDRGVTFAVDDGLGDNSVASAVATVSVVANDPPVLTGLDPSVTFAEHDVNAGPQLLDPTVTLTDTEGNFDGGTLTVSGLLPEDSVGISDVGTGAHQVSVSGSDISYEGTLIGSFTGGDGQDLNVSFNAAATNESVQAVLQDLTYADASDAPTASRELIVNVADSFGADLGVSAAVAATPHFHELVGPTNPFDGLAVQGFSAPAFVDLDGDGDLDLVVGDFYGHLAVALNDHGVFTPVSGAANPLAGLATDYLARPAFVDIDGDGDMDLVVGGFAGGLRVFGNDHGVFTALPDAANPLLNLYVGGSAAPAFVDLDGDGDMDLVVGDASGTLHAFQNDHGVFTELTGAANPFDGIQIPGSATPTFVDLDGDGDMDLVVGDNYGELLAFRNDGGTFHALTGADNPLNGIIFGYSSAPAFVDVDGDGDIDLVIGSHYGTLETFENAPPHGQPIVVNVVPDNDAPLIDLDGPATPATGTAITWAEGQPPVEIAPLGTVSDPDQPANYGGYTLTAAFTANGTTDDQLGIQDTGFGPGGIHVSGNEIFFEGTDVASFTGGANGAALTVSFNAYACGCSLEAVLEAIDYSNSAANPSLLDRDVTFTVDDGSGAANATASAVATISLAENHPPVMTGLDPSVTFAEHVVNAAPQLLDPTVTLTDADDNFDGGTLTVSGLLAEDSVGISDVGTGAHQVSVSGNDISYEGTLIGSFTGGDGHDLNVVFNADATSESVQAVLQDLTYADASDAPTASRELIVNVADSFGADLGISGALTAPAHFHELVGPANPLGGLAVYGLSAPTFVDLDGDGDMDLVVGNAFGSLNVAINDHGAFTPVFGAANPFDGIVTDYAARPAFVDIDGDGDMDLVVGGVSGGLQVFENDHGAFTELTGAANPLANVHVYAAAAPAFVDLDGDGDMDLVVGSADGSLHAFQNDHGVFTELTGAANPFNGILVDYAAAPTFVDLDGDGDMDLVVGDNYGGLHAFRNDAGTFHALTGAADPFAGTTAGYAATPAFIDLDGDGDMDLVTGNYYGSLQAFENAPPHGQPILVNVTPENDPPLLDLDAVAAGTGAAAAFTEGDPPLTIAPLAIFADPDQPANYGGYVVTAAFTHNGDTDDMLSIADLGSGPNQIAISGSDLLYQGVVVGSFTGGSNGDPLVVTFNAYACACSVELTLENILFSNASDNPSELTRTVAFTLDDGNGGIASADAIIGVTAVDDPPVAQDDAVATPENAMVSGSLFADNGSGPDHDPDGPALQIAEVNGSAVAVGTTIILASGAKLTVNSDGTYTYDPNGQFNHLTNPAGGEVGAVNTSATDSFTYSLVGGNTATVTVTVNGVATADDWLAGDSGANVITGTPHADFFVLNQGGDDTANGLGGNDLFYFGAAMTSADNVDGGPGNDQLALQGDYSTVPLTLGAGVVNVESLFLMAGSDTRLGDTAGNHYSYNITTDDANVASGQTLTVDGSQLRVGEDFTFNGSAET